VVLRELSNSCEEDYPEVAQYSSSLYTFSLFVGAGIGGYLSYPDRHNIVEEDSTLANRPFMLPSIIVSIINLLAFCLCAAMLTETLTIRNARPQKPPPEFKNDLAQNKTKYVELSEVKTEQAAPTQPQNYADSEGPVTERQENEQDEDLPSYLQMSDFVLMNGEEEEMPPLSNYGNIVSADRRQGMRFFSPKASQNHSSFEHRRPQSARPKLLNSFRSPLESVRSSDDRKGSFNELHETPITSYSPRVGDGPNIKKGSDIKCTHISYIEEDFERIQSDSPTPEVTLENKFRRYHVSNILKDPATLYSLMMKSIHSFITGYHDELILFWMFSKHGFDISPFGISVVLMIVYTIAMTTSYYKLDDHTIQTPLHKLILNLLLISLLLNFGFPNILYLDRRSSLIGLVLVIIYIPLYTVNNMTANCIMLLVADSTNNYQREMLEKVSDGLSLFFRGIGTFLGPLILHTLSESKLDYRIGFILPGVLLLFLSGMSVRIRKYFPRFYQAPYVV
jgi:hypothetical protein